VNTRRKLYETNYVREFDLCTRICCLCMLCVCCMTREPDEKYFADLFFMIHTFNTYLLVFMYSYIYLRPRCFLAFQIISVSRKLQNQSLADIQFLSLVSVK